MTTANLLADFLLPQLNDPLQMVFLSIIVLMMGFTIISTHKMATPESWELKWNRGTPDDKADDLDIEHGSVTDLWHAVSTAPEKLAEVMPGMLLVVGLLGTFIGLGLALNSASNILGSADALSASGAADSIQNLLGLLQGLGTKFKTSTWGITGFICLKIWSEATRFEEKRLTWVIAKVKKELEQRKYAEEEKEVSKQKALFKQIRDAAVFISSNLSEQVKESSNLVSSTFSREISCCSDQLIKEMIEGRQGLASVSLRLSEQIKESSSMLAKTISQEIDAGKSILIDAASKSTLSITDQISQVGNSINLNYSEGVKSILLSDKVLHRLIASSFSSQTDVIQGKLESICVETKTVASSMAGFTDNTVELIKQMAEASDGMADGASKVGEAGSALVDAIDSFKSEFTNVLDQVRNDLGASIRDLSEEASQTLEKGSTELGNATREISVALSNLSGDVKATMDQVQRSVSDALSIQEKSARQFTLSNTALNENLQMTTEQVEKLATPITEGLSAVSSSGQQMKSIGKSLEAALKVFAQIEQLPPVLASVSMSLEPIKAIPSHQKEILLALKSMSEKMGLMPDNLSSILRELEKVSCGQKEMISYFSSDKDRNGFGMKIQDKFDANKSKENAIHQG